MTNRSRAVTTIGLATTGLVVAALAVTGGVQSMASLGHGQTTLPTCSGYNIFAGYCGGTQQTSRTQIIAAAAPAAKPVAPMCSGYMIVAGECD